MIKLTTYQFSQLRHTFVEMLVRDGWTRSDAEREHDKFLVNGMCPLVRDAYLMCRRTGACVSLDRKKRQSVYMTFENALNHVTFGKSS